MVLDSWDIKKPTGLWYKTTRKQANWLEGCFEEVNVQGKTF